MALEEGRHEFLVGLFYNRETAEEAYDDMREAGYTRDEINVIMSNDTKQKYYPEGSGHARSEVGSKAVEGMGTGREC